MTGEQDLLALLEALAESGSRPVYAIVDAQPAAPERALVGAAALAELRRRLGAGVQAYGLPGGPTDLLGEPVRTLSSGETSADPLGQVSAVVVLGATEAVGPERADRVSAIEASGGSAVEAGPEVDAALAFLAPRLFSRQEVTDRLQYLQVSGVVPVGSFAYVDLSGSDADSIRHVVTTLVSRGERPIVESDAGSHPLDVVAAIAAAELVITDSPTTLALAVSQRRPAVGVTARLDGAWTDWTSTAEQLIVAGKAELAERLQGGPVTVAADDTVSSLTATADDRLDSLSRRLRAAGERPLALQSATALLRNLIDERDSLRAVNAGLRSRLAAERRAMAGYVRSHQPSAGAAPAEGRDVAQWQRKLADQVAALDATRAEMVELRGEIDRIYATRTMRALQPVRRWYARLRPRTRP